MRGDSFSRPYPRSPAPPLHPSPPRHCRAMPPTTGRGAGSSAPWQRRHRGGDNTLRCSLCSTRARARSSRPWTGCGRASAPQETAETRWLGWCDDLEIMHGQLRRQRPAARWPRLARCEPSGGIGENAPDATMSCRLVTRIQTYFFNAI